MRCLKASKGSAHASHRMHGRLSPGRQHNCDILAKDAAIKTSLNSRDSYRFWVRRRAWSCDDDEAPPSTSHGNYFVPIKKASLKNSANSKGSSSTWWMTLFSQDANVNWKSAPRFAKCHHQSLWPALLGSLKIFHQGCALWTRATNDTVAVDLWIDLHAKSEIVVTIFGAIIVKVVMTFWLVFRKH